jgi:hypothetical protein
MGLVGVIGQPSELPPLVSRVGLYVHFYVGVSILRREIEVVVACATRVWQDQILQMILGGSTLAYITKFVGAFWDKRLREAQNY